MYAFVYLNFKRYSYQKAPIFLKDVTFSLISFHKRTPFITRKKVQYSLTCLDISVMKYCYHDSLPIAECYTNLDYPCTLISLLQVPFLILGNLTEIPNLTLYLNHSGRLFSFHYPCLGDILHQPLFAFFTTMELGPEIELSTSWWKSAHDI